MVDPSPFPLFPGEPKVRGPIKKSRMGRRRAFVLGAVHVLILLHVTHWLTSGSTISPVEPSESMRTLELGEVNAGFVFFVLATVSCLVFGRFVCGWACHLVALQDLCAWMMKKLGVRPRPFRSRLLAWAPVLLAFYMFAWPTVNRFVVNPLMRWWRPDTVPPHAFPGFESHLVTTDFWATFPGWAVAIPFLGLCGFGLVYLLGSKAFCTYGCPYGPVFAAAEQLSARRIRVDPDKCAHCGHCTIACTSNVRVHEEVREFGMVVDSGCMKCLDCVSTCPNDALSYSWGPVALKKGAPRTGRIRNVADLRWPAEVALAALFAASFLCWRGVYDAIPLLMTMGIAAAVTFLTWILYRLVAQPNVTLQNLRAKQDGRLRAPGVVLAGLAVIGLLLTAQSGAVRYHRAQAEALDGQVSLSRPAAMALNRAPVPEATLDFARRAHAHYERADRWDRGGLGLLATPEVTLRRAWLAVVTGDFAEAAGFLAITTPTGEDGHALRRDSARLLRLAGQPQEAESMLRSVVAENPVDTAAHRELADLLLQTGNLEAAAAELVILVNLAPQDASVRPRLVQVLEQLGRSEDAARYR